MASAPRFPAAGAAEERSAAGRAKAMPGTGTPEGDRRGPRPRLQHPPPPTLRAAGGEGARAARDSAGSSQARTEHALGSVCAGVDSALPLASPARQAGPERGRERGPPAAPTAGGTPGPCAPGPERPPPHPASPGGRGQPPFFLLAGPWLSPPGAPRTRGPQPGPHPRHDPTKAPPRSDAHLPAPAARLRPAQPKPPSGQSLEKPPSRFPTGPGGLQPPLETGCHGQVGASRRVPGFAPGPAERPWPRHPRRRQRGGAQSPGLRHPRHGSPRPRPAPLPSALRSACIFPRGWRVSTRSPRPSGSHLLVGQQPEAPTTRRPRRALGGGHGVAAPGVRGAATRAGSRPGPPRPPPEPQGRRRAGGGRDGLQTPSPGGAARGAATLGQDPADTPPELGRPGLRSVRNFSRPSLSRPLQLLPASGLPALEGRDPGQGRSANSRPPRRSAQPIRNALPLRGRLQTTNPVGEDFYQPYYSAARREGEMGETV